MADLAPFAGWTYDFDRVGGPEAVLAPPYDVITADEAGRMAASSPHHIIHLILGKPAPGTEFGADVYARAAETWRRWRREGVLRREPCPALYTYDIEFDDLRTGGRWTRRGIMGALRLVPFEDREVLPHEEVFPGPLSDRIRLLEATDAAFCTIFALYSDPLDEAGAALANAPSEPLLTCTDARGCVHRVRRVRHPGAVAAVREALRKGPIIIADGHHRYTAALEHARRKGRLTHDGTGARTLVCLSNTRDPGVRAYGTHRLFSGLGGPPNLDGLTAWARVERIDAEGGESLLSALDDASAADTSRVPAFVFLTSRGAFVVRIGKPEQCEGLLSAVHPVLRRQPLTLLHEVLLSHGLGLRADQLDAAGGVSHTRDADEALRLVRAGACDLAVLVKAPAGEDLSEVCSAGQRMPHKATYFYPKLLSGCVLMDLSERM